MKKTLAILVILFGLTITIYGNSGPPEMTYVGGTEMLIIDEDTSISVEKEHLLFQMPSPEDNSYADRYRATASYTMVNESEEAQNVKMVFPYPTMLSYYNEEDVRVTVDGEPIPFQVFIGKKDQTENYPPGEPLQFDFQDALSVISTGAYESTTLNKATEGTHYIIGPLDGVVEGGRDLLLTTYVWPMEDGVKTIALGNHDGGDTRKGYRLDGYTALDERLHLFVYGGSVSLEYDVYKDYTKEESLSVEVLLVEEETMTYGDFYEAHLSKQALAGTYMGKSLNHISDEEVYNYVTSNIDRSDSVVLMTGSEDGLLSTIDHRRFLSIYYEVAFEAGDKREVTVSYNGVPSYRRVDGMESYTIDYLLSPAKYWKSFGDLTIELELGQTMDRLEESNVGFQQTGKGHYVFTQEGLPAEELKIIIGKKSVSQRISKGFMVIGTTALVLLLLLFFYKRNRGSMI